jgi:hypothetical protein
MVVTSLAPREEQEIWDRLGPISHWLEARGALSSEVRRAMELDSYGVRARLEVSRLFRANPQG